MTSKFTRFISSLSVLLSVCLLMASCQKESELDIPSYISIDTITLHAGSDQGTASSKIVDAWVYTDNDLEGAFELPASFPVLKSGQSIIRIQPGIKLNGIAETRAPYPFFDTISIPASLTRENELELETLTASYKASTVFAWMEDFEDPSISMDTTNRSDVKLVRVSDMTLSSAFQGEGNDYAGQATLPTDSSYFECVSKNYYEFSQDLPEEKSYVFMELNYKSNSPLTVGLIIYGVETSQQAVVVINPSETWNKIYINLTPTISFNTDATKFKVFFSARKDSEVEEGKILIDNIKLLHF